MSIYNYEACFPLKANQALPLSFLSKDPQSCSSQNGHKVATNAQMGPELGLVPHQSQDPDLLHPDLHPHILLARQEANPKVLRKERAC